MIGQLARATPCALLLSAGLSLAGPATAASTHTQSASKTFKVRSQTTATLTLGFPFALKYGNATYSGKVRILPPARGAGGQARPRRALVKVLSKGSAEGGSVYRAKVRNDNAAGAAPIRVRITTTTTWSS